MSLTYPVGFRAAGVAAGLKASGAPDVALVVNDGPSDVVAAVYTSNRCKANPVLWSEQVTADGRARAVVLNSGGANCYTGPDGFAVTHRTAEFVADLLGIGAGEVVVCSTGLIGLALDPERLLPGVRSASESLSDDGGPAAARAIMTTDTVPKQSELTREGFRVGAMAKGAGMLAPALATMLVVITTDADVDAATADRALRRATRVTFDRLDSDGCQSTNDTVALMVSGASGVQPSEDVLAEALTLVCDDLAAQLMSDAEGASHDILIEVVGAASEDDAVEVGRSIARNNLFTCAIYGNDPNWGRVLAAVGTTAAAFDPLDLDVSLNGVMVCRGSTPHADPAGIDLTPRRVDVRVDLKTGPHTATIRTNDLTTAYVHENSAYST
ncbi:MAG: bifunctional glutamate N-acetyltransferase/amino-acid acetyltransferase ArgJ [Actinomycetales bacterium]